MWFVGGCGQEKRREHINVKGPSTKLLLLCVPTTLLLINILVGYTSFGWNWLIIIQQSLSTQGIISLWRDVGQKHLIYIDFHLVGLRFYLVWKWQPIEDGLKTNVHFIILWQILLYFLNVINFISLILFLDHPFLTISLS